jgi:hypothetical protein
MSRTLVENLDYMLTVDDNNTVLTDVSLVIVDGRIEAIGPAGEITDRYDKLSFGKVIDGRNWQCRG